MYICVCFGPYGAHPPLTTTAVFPQRWICARQMPFSGGFQGRANKLVDGCYSFWQGGCAVLLAELAKGTAGALAPWISEEDAAVGAAVPAGPVRPRAS